MPARGARVDSIGDRAERTTGSIVSANYFDAIGVPPMLGRGFTREEDNVDARVVVPAERLRTNTSVRLFVSLPIRLVCEPLCVNGSSKAITG